MRTYNFVFGTPVTLDGSVVDINNKIDKSQNNAYQIKDSLQIEFNVKKDNSKQPNKAYVTVYNLSDFIVDYLKSNIDKSLAGLLEAGYDGVNYQLFCGSIEHIEDKWDEKNVTRTTKFIFGDAVQNITKTNANRSYRAGTAVSKVITDLVSDLQLPLGRIVNISGTLSSAESFSGNAADNIKKICDRYSANFSVQDGAVYIDQQGKRAEESVLFISENTGLIGVPELKQPYMSKIAKQKANANKEDDGIRIKTMLYGPVIPGSTVYLESKNYTGFYKVVAINHQGSWEGGDWYSELSAVVTTGTLVNRGQ